MTQPCPLPAPAPEFSRRFLIDALPARRTVSLEATPAERQALARRFDLIRLDSLKATLQLRKIQGGARLQVRGTLEGQGFQTCVVSLEPVAAVITESFTVLFSLLPAAPDGDLSRLYDVTLTGNDLDDDSPEPLDEEGRIDLGELVAQHFSLALDPYPRAEGVAWVHHEDDPATDAPAEEPSPAFSAASPGDSAASPEETQKAARDSPRSPFAALARWRQSH